MSPPISHLLAALVFSLSLVPSALAQANPPAECPNLNIGSNAIGPSKGVHFSYVLIGIENSKDLAVSWTLATSLFDPASIKIEGQGTLNASFILPETYHSGSITMMATVNGLPSGCGNTASESFHWDGPPEAVKIGKMRNTAQPDLDLIRRFRGELKNNPNNQGYIFIAYPPLLPKEQLAARERAVMDAMMKEQVFGDYDASRITLVQVTSSSDVTEFWRVPPGADNPICDACESVRAVCPSIGIERGAGIVKAGDHLEFQVNDRDDVGGLTFHWTVKNGRIESGQGTSKVRILPITYLTRPVEALVKVRGLPEGCADTFQESYAVPCHPYLATSIDVSFWSEYRAVPWLRERKQLEGIVARGLRWQAEKVVYIEKGFPLNSTIRTRNAAINRIRNYVLTTLRIPRNKLYIRSRIGRSATRLYLVPDDSPVLDPNWKESCVQE